MNFVFFSAQYLPTVGGVERYTYNLSKQLVKNGHSVVVITSSLENLPAQEEDENGIKIYRLPSYPAMGGRFPVIGISGIKKISKIIDENNIDFAVIQTRLYPLCVVAAYICKKMNVKTILIDHSTGHMQMSSKFITAIGNFYEHISAYLLKKKADAFYGVSGDVCRWLNHFGINAKGTFCNAIDIDHTSVEEEERYFDVRQSLSLPEDAAIVLFAGRLIHEKGVDVLVDAFSDERLKNYYLVVAGDGELFQQLNRKRSENVFLLGNVNHGRLLNYMSQSNLYCLPTLYAEGFPTTFLEAAFCKCPILTTFTGGSGEIIPDENYGVRIKEVSREVLVNKVKEVLEDKKSQNKFAENSYNRLMDKFTWEKVSQVFLEECNRLGKDL